MARFYTPLITGSGATAANINNRLQQLDNAINDHSGAIFNVTDPIYGTPNNGVADATAGYWLALDDAEAAGKGTVYFAEGEYLITARRDINTSNITIAGAGPGQTIIHYMPAASGTAYSRWMAIHAGDVGETGFTGYRDVSGSIALGATSFTAADAGDTDDLSAGDWLYIAELYPDAGLGEHTATEGMDGEIINFDWVQVASVAGTTVNVYNPFRIAFGALATVKFHKIVNLVENVTVRDMTIRPEYDNSQSALGITVGIAKDTLLQNIEFDPIDNTFGSEDIVPDHSFLSLDFGTGFFSFQNNNFINPITLGVFFFLGVHHGEISGNQVGYVKAAASQSHGFLMRGVHELHAHDNFFVGAESSASSIGINSGGWQSGSAPTYNNFGNVYSNNRIGDTFASAYALAGGDRIDESKSHIAYTGSGDQRLTAAVTTTNNTATDLYTRVMDNDTVATLEVKITARRTDSGDEAGYYWRRICARRTATTTSIIATDTVGTDHESVMTGTITVDTSSTSIRVRVTGQSSKTIIWVATIEMQVIALAT
jgi:hypothetical protein